MSVEASIQKNFDSNSVKELIRNTREWILYFKAKWIVLLIVGGAFSVIGFFYASVQKPLYTASLRFALEDEKSLGGGVAGALGFASSLGFDVGSVSAGGAFSGANLLELMKSRSLVEKTLLQPIKKVDKTISLANYLLESLYFDNRSDNLNSENNILFPPFSNRSNFTLKQDSLLGVLYYKITGKNGILNVSQKDKKVSIFTIEVKSEDQFFSKIFAESLAKVVSDFYVETKSKKAKLNYEILQKQTDSVRAELNMAITGVAAANDMTYNLNPALNVRRIPSAKRQIDVQANTAILSQLIANLEMAKVALRKETPLIQIIDNPILPLPVEKAGKTKTAIVWGFFAIFFTSSILVFIRILKQWQVI